MDKIYVITVFSKIEKDELGYPHYGDTRTVAWYDNHDDAKLAILNNNCDMYESVYNYAVLETIPKGIYPVSYENYACEYFEYNKRNDMYCPIENSEVEICPGILTCWSIG